MEIVFVRRMPFIISVLTSTEAMANGNARTACFFAPSILRNAPRKEML